MADVIYIFNGQEVSASELESYARASGLSVQEFKDQNNVTVKEGSEDFQQVTAAEDVPAVTGTEDTSQIDRLLELELQQENTFLALQKATDLKSKQSTYKSRNEYAVARQNYNNAKKKLRTFNLNSDMDIKNPISIINKGEKEVQDYLTSKYKGLIVEPTGIKNAVNIYFPGQDEPTELDLKPFTEAGVEEGVSILKNLDKAFKNLSLDDKVENSLQGLVSLTEERRDTTTINRALQDTGYEIQRRRIDNIVDGQSVTGIVYDIYKDGNIIQQANVSELRDFIDTGLGDDAYQIIKTQAYEDTSTYLQERARQIEEEEQVIFSDKTIDVKYMLESFQEDLILSLRGQGIELTEEEIQQIRDYRGVDYISGDVRDIQTQDGFKRVSNTPYQLEALRNLSGLPQSVGEKILQAGGKDFIQDLRVRGIKEVKKQELEKRSKTISERLIAKGDPDLLRFGQGIAGIEKEVFEQKTKKRIEALPEAKKQISKVLNARLKQLMENAPEGTKARVDISPSGQAIFDITNKNTLTGDDARAFKNIQSQMLKLQQDYGNLQTDYANSLTNLQNDITEFYANNPENQQVFKDSMKEYGLGSLVAKDVNDAFAGILLAIPTLMDSEYAIEQQKRLNAKNEFYETMGTYDDGDFGTYFFRTLGQQSANILLAIGTGGASSAMGLSSAMTANAIGGLFGISSGTQTYRDLKTQQQIIGTADKQAKVAQQAYEDGTIDLYSYTRMMRDINKTRAMNELTDDQIVGASVANGIIEGTFTRFLGTAPNTIKLLKDFKTPTKLSEVAKNLRFGKAGPNNYEKIANLIGKPLLTRGAGEIAEEELIYGGQQFITEYGILDRDLDLSAWDETAMSTVITLGASQSPGVAYSGILTYNATKNFEQQINKLRLSNNQLSTLIQSSDISADQKKLLLNDMAANLKQEGLEVDKLGVHVLGMQADDVKRLVGTEIIKRDVLLQAGVLPGMSEVDKAEAIKLHKESLTKDEADLFDTQLNVLDKQINEIKDKPTSIKKAQESLGSLWTNNDKYLEKTNKDGYKSKTPEQKIIAVINQVRESVGRESKKAAKANPEVVAIVESETQENGKPLNKKQKEIRYRELGDQMALDRSRAISVAAGVNAKAADIFADVKSVNYVEYKTEDELKKALEDQGIDVNSTEYKDAVTKFENNGTYGAVIGNTIITQNADQAKADIDNGQIQAGTVILHEFSHIADDARIKPENRKMYAENLAAAASQTSNQALKAIDRSVRNMLDKLYAKDKLTFENSEKYRDEYTKVMQEYLYAYEDKVKIEKEDNLMTRIFNGTNPNNLNTPEKALQYLAANNAAFRSGKISKKTKKALKDFKGTTLKKSDKDSVNRLALDYKKDPKSFETTPEYTDFFMQYQSVALDAMGYNVGKGDILATDASQFVATEFPSIIRNYKPVDKDGNKQAFTTYVFNVFKRGRGNKFYKQELEAKEGRTSITGAAESTRLVSTDTAESGIELEERRAKEAKARRKLINPLSAKEIGTKKKAIEDAVVITPAMAPIADFKSISKDYGGKVAGIIFDVPEAKITDGTKNLTYAKKIVDGVPEPSEAGNIQNLYSDTQVLARDIRLLPDTNVTSEESRVGEQGEKVTVTRDVQGRSLGLPNRIIKYFYEDTGKRSKGTTSQTKVYKKKAKFNNPTPQVLKEVQREMGITPAGQLNQYNRTIGQFLKGFAKVKGSVAAVAVAKNKVATLDTKTSKGAKQIEADIGAGRSKLQLSEKTKQVFSNPTFKLETRGVDGLLKAYGIDGTFKLKTREDVDAYIADIKKNLLPLMPKEFWFGKTGGTQFTPSSKVLGKNEKALYKEYYMPEMKKLALDENQKFGKPILVDGKPVDFSKPSYDSLFKTKEIIQAKIKSGAIKAFNKKVGKIHQEMWYRFNDAIRKDKNNAKVIGNYLKMTGSDTSHWHKMGAQFVGYSNEITGTRFEYEHAMPATSAYLYLLDVSLSKAAFERAYDFVIDNYKLISLDKAMDKKLTAVGLRSSMPEGWNLLDNKWYDRYFSELVATQDGGIDPAGLIGLDGKNFQEIYGVNNYGNTYVKGFKSDAKSEITKNNTADKAMANARDSAKYSEKPRKARVFDFDDTLARSKSMVIVNMPDGSTRKINATEFALEAGNLEQEGAIFDFSEFSKVIDGKKGPLFDVAKFISEAEGQRDMFVLTARPADSALAIKEFLDRLGLNIPIENIIGLADGKAKAKADWFIQKYSEGYNDFYFADDALKNVKAVKDVFNVLDVKSQVQQARVKFSEKMSTEFNDMIERNKGVKSQATFSDVQARRRGTKQKKYSFFIPPSADDFRGLTQYTFAGKGKQGEADQEFFDKALIRPYQAGVAAINRAKFRIRTDYGALVKNNKKIAKRLKKTVAGTNHTLDEAIRVYLWNKEGYDIPGMSKRDVDALVSHVESGKNGELIAYAEGVKLVTRKDAYPEPTEYWDGSTILGDLNNIATETNRAEYLKEFIDNSKIIFSEQNLNKVEAVYGFRVRESIENILFRMETGQNKAKGTGRIVNQWNDWVNNSVGAIMFFNRRSALMQTLSTVNFVNWSDNNPIKAAAAFANQPQYWKDFITLWSSPKLIARRKGLESDIQEAEIARAAKKGGVKGVISYLLKIGFTPTQLADSFAIASGGATFYRNRIKSYLKETNDQGEKVYTKEQAEQKAFEDFSSIAEETQQSGDPMLVSQQQASVLGRLVLAFQNTPMQYTRLIKKAGQDLINRRGNPMTSMSKIVYYGFVQNLIFSTLQNALFALIPGFDDEEEDFKTDKEREKYLEGQQRKEDKKVARVANSMIDTLLRGSGLAGAVISTIKNVIIAYQKYDEAPMIQKENADIILAALNISPPIGSKARKINNVLQTMQFEKDVLAERGFSVMIDGHFQLSPAYDMLGDLTSATLNLPLDRVADEVNAITEALDTRNTQWQRIALALGWRQWDVGARAEEHDLIKTEAKAKRKVEGKEKAKETRKRNKLKKYNDAMARSRVLKNIPKEVKKEIKNKEKTTGFPTPVYKLKELAKQYNIDISDYE